jgi:hypothetical protein
VTVSRFTSVVVLRGRHPAVSLSIRVAGKAVTIRVSLRDARGRTLAAWHLRVRPGISRLTFRLSAKARRPGRDRLVLLWPGGSSKVLRVTVRRPR